MSQSVDLQGLMKRIATNKAPYTDAELQLLSDAEARDVRAIMPLWNEIPENKKRDFLDELYNKYENDTRVNYENFAVALLDDPSDLVKILGLLLLGENNQSKVADLVLRLAKNSKDEDVQVGAISRLGLYIELFVNQDMAWPASKDVFDYLLATTQDPNNRIAQAALKSLATFDDPLLEDLIGRAFAHNEASWQEAGIYAAGKVSDTQWLGNILNALQHPDIDVRLAAVSVCGNNMISASRQPLIEMLEDEENDEIFHNIIWSLSCIGGEDVRTVIEAIMAETEEEMEIEMLEEALENLSLTEEMEQFDIFKFDADDEDLIELDEEIQEPAKSKTKRK